MLSYPFFVAANFFQNLNYFILEQAQEKIEQFTILHRILLFIKKIVIKLSEIWVGDQRSGIRENHKAPDPGIRIRNTGYVYYLEILSH